MVVARMVRRFFIVCLGCLSLVEKRMDWKSTLEVLAIHNNRERPFTPSFHVVGITALVEMGITPH